MSLQAGARLGPYEIVSLIGSGGMGEVYRARDTKLHRDVALKVLPDEFAANRERVARFEREAQTLASFNHPHIAGIYGVEPIGHAVALVLELVEGPTLADRIRRGPIGLDEARAIAHQIALALEAAHDGGVIHRDLKPANIKLASALNSTSMVGPASHDSAWTVKVLDFGLARALDPAAGPALDLVNSPTITSPVMTGQGVILGTATYMAPEQARGRPVDKRADIWAFGCVLFEMLTGKPPFDGEDVAAVLGAVIRLEPDWTRLPESVPATIVWVLKRCLQKDPRQRMRDIADVWAVIDEMAIAVTAPTAVQRPSRASFGWVAAGFIALAATVVIVSSPSRRVADPPETRLQLVAPTDDPASMELAPDGRSIVYRSDEVPLHRLWLRKLSDEDAKPLAGTDDARSPVWSPDGRAVAFFSGGELKRIDLANESVRTLAPASNGRRGAWSKDGVLLFGSNVGPLLRVSADEGGTVTPVTTLAAGQTNHRTPQFLPDGRRFLFFALGTQESRGLFLGSLDDKIIRRVADRDDGFAFVPPDRLVVARSDGLWTRRLNLDAMRLEGELTAVAPHVLVYGDFPGSVAVSGSAAGALAYRPPDVGDQLVWFDRQGRETGALGSPERQLPGAAFSPDARTVAVTRSAKGNMNVWLYDIARGVARPVTSDPTGGAKPVFSPDGTRMAYVSDARADVYDIFVRQADGTGTERRLLETGENLYPQDWSRDGKYLSYTSQNPEGNVDLWAVPLVGDVAQKPIAVARTKYFDNGGAFSPDGRWVTVISNESGQSELYVQSFPVAGPKIQVSTSGASQAQWTADGRELIYVAREQRVMSVPVTVKGAALEFGLPRTLFLAAADISGLTATSDGQRFLGTRRVTFTAPITLLLNWKPPR